MSKKTVICQQDENRVWQFLLMSYTLLPVMRLAIMI